MGDKAGVDGETDSRVDDTCLLTFFIDEQSEFSWGTCERVQGEMMENGDKEDELGCHDRADAMIEQMRR